MHRFNTYRACCSRVFAVAAVTCILTLGAGSEPAAAQDRPADAENRPVDAQHKPFDATASSEIDSASVDVAADSTRVIGDLVRSGRIAQLEGHHRLLSPHKHDADRRAAAEDFLDLGTLRGKHVLLDFWVSWCRPCIEEIPDLNALAEELGGREDVVFISVNQDALTSGGDLEYVHRLVGEGSIKYPVLIDDAEPSLKRAFKIRAWPTRIMISPDGEILVSPGGRLELEEAAEYLRHH